ncbi:MAG TPA: aldo/keto reductase, partial [Actinomycetota bacterium]|nr:aldo/keto reductase [Actinomycetota bacterium]
RSGEQAQKDIERLRPQLERWEALCGEIGERPADVALAWLLHNPVVTAPIIGPRTVEQLDSTMHTLEIELTEDLLAKLDELFPGPGGPAPEAWAW